MGKGLSARDSQRIWDEALAAGKAAAEERYEELQKNGPAWNVVNDQRQVVGQMLDLCGFAWVRILRINRRAMNHFVAYLTGIGVGSKSLQGGYMLWGSLVFGGQEIGPKEAGMKALAAVLHEHGLEVEVENRLD